jgi:cytoskeleton protein RodZ
MSVHKQVALEFYRPKPDGSIDPAGEAGWYLQRERERNGLTLEDASATIGIHAHHLEAIETGDLTGLPARSQTLGMIGAYAEYLGFDPQPLILHFVNFLPPPIYADRDRRKKKPRPLSSAKIIDLAPFRKLRDIASGAGGIVASCLAAVLLFGIELPATDEVPVASITRVAEEVLNDDQQAQASGLGAEADRAANALNGLAELIQGGMEPTAKTPQAADTAMPADISDLAANLSKLTPPHEVAGGRIYGEENLDARLVLSAKAPVWLRIEDGHGTVIVTKTLNAGDSYRVPNREGLVVISRDGGLISYRIDGKLAGDLGAPGEILVGRSLDLKRLAGL